MFHRILLYITFTSALLYASPLLDAVKANDAKQVEILLKNGADPYEYVSTYPYHVICYAAAFSDSNILKQLLNNSSNVDKPCYTVQITPLMSASAYNNIDNMELLVKKGANVNAKQIGMSEPNVLLYALSAKQTRSSLWLIDHGADINYAGTYGNNALSITIAENNLDLLNTLIKKGINLKGKNGFDALLGATVSLKYNFVKLLVDHGVNLNYTDQDGNTILHLIASGRIEYNLNGFQKILQQPRKGFPQSYFDEVQSSIDGIKGRWDNYDKIIHYLTAHGADKNLKNKAGKTPLQIAIEQKNQRVITILKSSK